MSNEDIIAKIETAMQSAPGFDKSVKFDFGDDGVIVIDGSTVSGEPADTDCTIAISKDNFVNLAQGNLDPMMAFMSGKLKVTGDMSVAMSLQSLFKSM